MNDVYAGDDSLDGDPQSSEPRRAFTFRILADADPDVLLRVASQLLLSNVAPYAVAMKCVPPGSVYIHVELRGVSASMAESIQRKLSRLSCTETVEVCKVS